MANGIIMTLKKFKLLPLSGDASFRKYYRKFYRGKKFSTIIVTSKKEKYKNLLVYSVINQFLLSQNIKAPRLLSKNYREDFIEIEDFGNVTIYHILRKSRNKFHIYKKVIELLIKLQKIKPSIAQNFFGKSYKLKKYSVKNLNK